ncbi:TetR/AcrR family transcriptional regulator [Amycolatopsis cynarae]|uniref:TetR/AcrR family transcriptional regulator n=1 Tax=Amycolatopsis cynarae TaxID=2995223 RepID=A0ABY7B8Q9_9PSEU|nr:TetR/AcrR family transcriptional regulator [Amycolatopsis sp. HUAS 11-8]WAL68324.1 TetR/AcrR family transcriptional regulator [Amycolatopsis sp. HUAS 11-8]
MEPVRRIVDGRRAGTVQRLLSAAVEEVRAVEYHELTVRSVARRADVSPATAYTYFSSKEHLVSSILWWKLQAVPIPDPVPGETAPARLVAVIRGITQLFADEPELSRACTTALLADDAEVRRLRNQIGTELVDRLTEAIGPMPDTAAKALTMATVGGFVLAGTGYLPFEELPERLADITDLLLESASPPKPRKRRAR